MSRGRDTVMGGGSQPEDGGASLPAWMEDAKRLVGQLPGLNGFRFNPLDLIKAVNYLHELGFEESLQRLEQVQRDGREIDGFVTENVLLVARVLYVQDSLEFRLPRLELGQADLLEPRDPEILPLFPLHLVEELPILLVGGYVAGGEAQPASTYLAWCARNCRLRPTPLKPGDRPLAAVDQFLASPAWLNLSPNSFHPGMVRLQALRSLPATFHASEVEQQAMLASSEPSPFWLARREDEERLKLVWQRSVNAYSIG